MHIVVAIIMVPIVLSLVSQVAVAVIRYSHRLSLGRALDSTSFSRDQILEDLAWVDNALLVIHPHETTDVPIRSIEDIRSELASLRGTFGDGMGRLDVYRALSPVITSMRDEHTSIVLPQHDVEQFLRAGGTLFPFRVIWIGTELFARDGGVEGEPPRGSRVVSINGMDTHAIRLKLGAYFSGTTEEQQLCHLASSFPAALAIIAGMDGPFEVGYIPPGESGAKLVKVDGVGETEPEQEPFSYRQTETGAGILALRSFVDPGGSFRAFLKDTFADLARQRTECLLIDLRGNRGGNTFMGDVLLSWLTGQPFVQYIRLETTVSREARSRFLSEAPGFIRWFPAQYVHPALKPLWSARPGSSAVTEYTEKKPLDVEPRFKGKVFILTDAGSMSSSTLLASTARKYVGATLVGRTPGGRDTMYGGMAEYYLPNTGLMIELPSAILYGNTIGSVIPDFEVYYTQADLAAGVDTVLEFCLKLCRQ